MSLGAPVEAIGAPLEVVIQTEEVPRIKPIKQIIETEIIFFILSILSFVKLKK
jgi:hypothetical protein